MNEILQELLNPVFDKKKRQLAYGDVTYRVGDKVLQLVNRPEDNVFNGDIGEIRAIFFAKENEERQDQLVVSFEGNEVIYTKQDLNQITLAYCCSIHKSQGSEFPIVILPVVRSYYRMLRRNLIYTAVTRSKNKLILCGEEDAFKMAVMRTDDSLRNSSLKERLEKTIQQEKERDESLLSYEEKLMETDPMVGMENTTPFDFINE